MGFRPQTCSAIITFLLFVWTALSGQAVDMRLVGCDSLPLLFADNGFRMVPVQRAVELGPNRYRFDLSPGPARFLFVGSSPDEHVPVIVGGGQSPLLEGHCLNLAGTEVGRSDLNRQFREYASALRSLRERHAALITRLAEAGSEAPRTSLLEQVKQLDREKELLWKEAQAAHELLGAYVGLFTYLGYPALRAGDTDTEVWYFARHFFDQAPLEDPVFNRIPQLAEAFKEYAQTLTRLSLSDKQREAFLAEALGRIPPGRPARRLAYAGILNGLRAVAFGLHAHFTDQLLEEFPALSAELRARLLREATQSRALAVGGQAPAFSQPGPEGGTVALRALRGKLVFVDFWASWCRPCRLENPRLRQLYANYRDRGFEVVGISLDVEHDRWVQAIEADKIHWLHGSDLQGWNNAVATDYLVSAIPHNVLIDPQGRILARNLSMEQLAEQLAALL